MRSVDLSQWPRREVFEFFSGMNNPFYTVTFPVDVTNLYRRVKEENLSFYYALVYLCTEAVNQVEAFRYSLDEAGLPVLLDSRSPSFTDLHPGSELFHIVTMPCEGSLEDFCRLAKKTSQEQQCFIRMEDETPDLIFFSCLPWMDVTGLTHEHDHCKDDAVPRISWGQYVDTNGQKQLHMTLEVNHRFIDGYHLGQFYQALTQSIEQL